jgi:hypothetical protein
MLSPTPEPTDIELGMDPVNTEKIGEVIEEVFLPIGKAACEAIGESMPEESSSIIRFMALKYKCLFFLAFSFLIFIWLLTMTGVAFFKGKDFVENIVNFVIVTTHVLEKINNMK